MPEGLSEEDRRAMEEIWGTTDKDYVRPKPPNSPCCDAPVYFTSAGQTCSQCGYNISETDPKS